MRSSLKYERVCKMLLFKLTVNVSVACPTLMHIMYTFAKHFNLL